MREEKIVRYFDVTMRASESSDMEVEGYALKFDKETIIGGEKWGFKEKINRNALNGAKIDNVILDFNHHFSDILSRTINGSLQLLVDNIGLKFTSKIVDTTIGRDVYKLVKEGLINRTSFVATVKKSQWTIAENSEQLDMREIIEFDRFYDVAAVTFPAYEDTLIEARSDFVYIDEDVKRFFENKSKQTYENQIIRLNKILGGK